MKVKISCAEGKLEEVKSALEELDIEILSDKNDDISAEVDIEDYAGLSEIAGVVAVKKERIMWGQKM